MQHKQKFQIKDGSPERRRAECHLNIKAQGEDGTFEGYGSVFGVKDSYSEIVAAGAFTDSLAEHRSKGTFPALLWQHDPSQPIGVYTEMREDAKGLFVKGQLLLDVAKGKEAHALLKAGALNGLSIGFMPVKSSYDEENHERTLTEVDLWEVSLVTFPANDKSRVEGVKAAIAEIKSLAGAERFLRDAKLPLTRSQATAIVSQIKDVALRQRDADQVVSKLNASANKLLALMEN